MKEHPDTVGGAMLSGLREAVRALDLLRGSSEADAAAEAAMATAEVGVGGGSNKWWQCGHGLGSVRLLCWGWRWHGSNGGRSAARSRPVLRFYSLGVMLPGAGITVYRSLLGAAAHASLQVRGGARKARRWSGGEAPSPSSFEELAGDAEARLRVAAAKAAAKRGAKARKEKRPRAEEGGGRPERRQRRESGSGGAQEAGRLRGCFARAQGHFGRLLLGGFVGRLFTAACWWR